MTEEELIETLKAFEHKRVEQLPENSRNLFYAIMSIADERDKYKNIVDELEKWLKKQTTELYEIVGSNNFTIGQDIFQQVLDKLEELKGSDR